jgi:hypothetical protein
MEQSFSIMLEEKTHLRRKNYKERKLAKATVKLARNDSANRNGKRETS